MTPNTTGSGGVPAASLLDYLSAFRVDSPQQEMRSFATRDEAIAWLAAHADDEGFVPALTPRERRELAAALRAAAPAGMSGYAWERTIQTLDPRREIAGRNWMVTIIDLPRPLRQEGQVWF